MTTFIVLVTALALIYQFLGSMRPPPAIYHIVNALQGLVWPDSHSGRATVCPRIAEELRYPETEPPNNTSNLHGEIEILTDGTQATHWYAQTADVTWHFVTAGDPSNTPILMLHGLPESWWAFHHQIADLSRDYYVIALDCKGYGQSDKRLDLDYSAAGMAGETAELLNTLAVDKFIVIAHDRGAIIADHMASVDSLKGRMLRYVRMQQSFNEPHGEPRPPHAMFATRLGEANFAYKHLINVIYEKVMPAGLNPATLKRLDYEFKFEGIAQAVRRYFQSNNFDLESNDRHGFLFSHMTMPILILQGRYDSGQHPEEYANSAKFVDKLRVEFVDASHFSHIENPEAVNHAIRRFLSDSA